MIIMWQSDNGSQDEGISNDGLPAWAKKLVKLLESEVGKDENNDS